MRRLTPTAAVLVAAVLAIMLFVYVFGLKSILAALVWGSIGAIVGWLGSLVLLTDTQKGILFDVVAGGVGALLGLLLIGGTVSGGGLVEPFFSAIIGSVGLVAFTGLVRPRLALWLGESRKRTLA